jgi:hypothetical protein
MSLVQCKRVWLWLVFLLATAGIGPAQESLSGAEFASLVQTLSEEGGYFFSDGFTSNEDSHLTAVDKTKELGATGTTAP